MRRRLIVPESIFDKRRSRRRGDRPSPPRAALSLVAAALMLGADAAASTSTGIDFGELLAGARNAPRTHGFDWIREPDAEIAPLMPVEREQLKRQRERIESTARRTTGRTLRGDDADLEVLQRLVDVDEIFLSIAPSYARLPGTVSVRGPRHDVEESTR